MKYLRTIVAALLILVAAPAVLAAPAGAQTIQGNSAEVCRSLTDQTGAACDSGDSGLTGVIRAVLTILSIVAGIAAVIMIVISGLRYVTSSGDASSVSGAKRSLIYAIIGLLVVVFAQMIVRFVLQSAN